jgi:hypothetical protein
LKKLLLLGLAAALLGSPALAQTPPSGNVERPLQYPCLNQQGKAAPCQFTDIPTPDVATAFNPASADKKAQVVTISPNSGAAGPYPANATPLVAIATGTTGAVAATFAAQPGRKNYICGFSVSPGSAATAITIQVTVTGLLTGTMTWAVGAPVTAAGTTGTTLTQNFNPCIPASAINTAIAVNSGALGTSGINNDVQSWGFQQ